MQVAQVIDTLGWGGVQELQVTLAGAARDSGINLTLLSLDHDDATPYRDRLRAHGVSTHLFPARRWIDPRRCWRVARFLRREGYDLVHSHLPAANIVGPLAARLAGIPAIGGLHLSSFHRHSALMVRLETWSLRRAARCVTACGQTVANIHRRRLRGAPIHAILNSVPAASAISRAERTRRRHELGAEGDIPLIIAVGRLSPEKGFDDLLSAAAHLRTTQRLFRLLIVGCGEIAHALAARCEALDLTDHVRLLGPRDDVPRLLAASDLYVSAAIDSEGLSIAMLEAMAAGLGVVATDVGDSAQLVVDGVGLVTPPGEPERLADALGTLLDDAPLRQAFGAAARAHVEDHYGVDAWFTQLRALYEEVVAGNAAA